MSDVVSEAQRLYLESLDAQSDQRTQIEEDMRFSDPSNPEQWDESIKLQREQDPGGRRPCLVMDQTGQYVSNVAGQVEKQPPSIHAIPVSGGADKEAAEQIDGRFRHVEYASKAIQHYQRALTSAARAGVGYLVVRPFMLDRALNWQEPRIGSEPDPLKVVFDPWSVETDGCDADFGYILTSFSIRDAEKRWKGKGLTSFGETQSRSDDKRKSVLIAEQWRKEDRTRNLIRHIGADGNEIALPEDEFWKLHQAGELPEQPVAPSAFVDKQTVVWWRRMSGSDVLEESVDPLTRQPVPYPADSIGIVPVYGYVSFVDGRMRYCGIPRRARGPQQAYNYHKSELLMPGGQLLASKRALAGVEPIWDKAQTQRRAFLPFNDMDEDGAVSPPSLIKVGSQLVDHVGGAESALRDIQAALGLYQANLGAPSNETSGVAIEGRKQQGEASTAHFPSHLAASLGQVGQIVLQMDAKLSDTRRQQPILGVDGSAGSVTVDPDQRQAFKRGEGGVTINPRVGTYGVRVVVGASFSTQRSQTNSAFAEIMRGNPELAPTVAPFWAQTLDFPGSDKFAQALAAMAPAPVKAILQPEGADKGPDPAEVSKQLDDCKKALNEAIEHAKAAQDDADEAISAAADAKRIASVKERELDIEAYRAKTERFKILGAGVEDLQLLVRETVEAMLQQPEPLPGDAPMPAEPEMPGDGPGPDGMPMHEQAEAPAFEQAEPAMEGEAPEPSDSGFPQQTAPQAPEA